MAASSCAEAPRHLIDRGTQLLGRAPRLGRAGLEGLALLEHDQEFVLAIGPALLQVLDVVLERFEFLGVGDRTVVQARLLGVLLLGHRFDLVLEPHLVTAELVELQPELPQPVLGGIGELTRLGERRPGRCQPAQPLELTDDAEPVGGSELAGDLMAAALVVGGWTESPRRGALQLDAGEEAVEREVEVEAGLLTVGDHVEAGGDLIVDGGDGGVVLQLGAIGRAELVEVLDGEEQPAGQRIAADHAGA